MGNNVQRSFRFEIDNFSEKEAAISSPIFRSGGCEWYLKLHPKGNCRCNDNVSMFLTLANPHSLPTGWIRKARFQFVLLNEFDKELYRSKGLEEQIPRTEFCAKNPSWGNSKTLPYINLYEQGFLETDRLIVEVYISDIELVDGKGKVVSEKETVDINGFQVFTYQVTSARKIFAEHPDIAEDFKPKNQVVKTEYMNVLLNLFETLNKPLQDHSEVELSNAHSKLNELMEQGFKLDWLKLKLNEFSLKRTKACDVGSQVQQLNKRVKNLELMKLDFKLTCLMKKLEEVSLKRKKSDNADGSWVREMEGRITNLEMMMSDLKVELGKEKATSSDDGFLLID